MTLVVTTFNVALTAAIIWSTWSLWRYQVSHKKAYLIDWLLLLALALVIGGYNRLVSFGPTLLALDLAVIGALLLIGLQCSYYRYFYELFEAYRLESWRESSHDTYDHLTK